MVVIFQASRARCLLILFVLVSRVGSSWSDRHQVEISYHTTKHARSPVDVVFALPAY